MAPLPWRPRIHLLLFVHRVDDFAPGIYLLVREPSAEPLLREAIRRDFGSFEAFKAQLTEVAATVMGSGWGTLVWEPIGQRLLTCQVYDHQSNLSQGGVSLLVIDAWEHAYYLQYQNRKAEYFSAVWDVVNWKAAEKRLQ